MRILITNDDGIYSEGLLALKAGLEEIAEVMAVAPDRPRSATGHAITLHKPLRISPVRLRDGSTGYSTNGTPSDCVLLGIGDAIEGDPDLVVSGINAGPNLGEDLTYSGTVSAAMEAAIFGYPSFAISVASYEVPDYSLAAKFAGRLTQVIGRKGLPRGTFLNVNVPDLTGDSLPPVQITCQGSRRYQGKLDKRVDPRGQTYYWLTGELFESEIPKGTDVAAIAAGRISITPIHLDLTNHQFIEELQDWGLEEKPR